ncbi:Nif3-like dinuclear metal center hexameric protein [Coraliomargarita akajimensis]|uniref:GTP cyclohydrolase 1 type 2 homolog n=1 Tax=Coraliomargarita akajimensis (strain DSM 45221 / IAM 15411 / JCM 23193 / KCTC 12865 / 04OKA010-24) TaxID=583355 RepID=D5EMW9_CORAD|nr:Nif3-like dinuclear metal center hexameric protein [Coraliomargarita akajimensis]ADE55359.1 protein of unknown function DUF34 [Coraliomargarita akajimensis DSM 45221]
MPTLQEIVAFCDQRVRLSEVKDFDGAYNGLQLENNGKVRKIAAAVDAGRVPFEAAIQQGADFIICHHGLYWSKPIPLVGTDYTKIKLALDNNLAVYGSHLPLDCHSEIGNNALLAQKLGLEVIDTFLPYEGTNIAVIAKGASGGRVAVSQALQQLFPDTYHAIEYGSDSPDRIAILTGSGQSAVPHLKTHGIDTLITGELRQHHFNMAQELKLNLYPCGHYATEVFGVQALAQEVAKHFDIEWTFIEQPCRI